MKFRSKCPNFTQSDICLTVREVVSLLLINENLIDDFSISKGTGGIVFFFVLISNSDFDKSEIVLECASEQVLEIYESLKLHSLKDKNYYSIEDGVTGRRFLVDTFYESEVIEDKYDHEFFKKVDERILKYYDSSKSSEREHFRFGTYLAKSLRYEKDELIFALKKDNIKNILSMIAEDNMLCNRISKVIENGYHEFLKFEIEESIDTICEGINFLSTCFITGLFTKSINSLRSSIIEEIHSYLDYLYSLFCSSSLSQTEDNTILVYIFSKFYNLIYVGKEFFQEQFNITCEKIRTLFESGFISSEMKKDVVSENINMIIKTILNISITDKYISDEIDHSLEFKVRKLIDLFVHHKNSFLENFLDPKSVNLGLSGLSGFGIILLKYFFGSYNSKMQFVVGNL